MKPIKRVLNWITTLLVPIFLILFGVRILLSPIFINVEYRLPGFPEDPYGFNFSERLHWADVSRKFLLNNDEIDILAEEKLDGKTPLYNPRELRHMVDVKVVLGGVLLVFYFSILYLVLYGYLTSRTNHWQEFLKAISRGGFLTVGLILIILIYLGINFNSLFTNFHRVFFEGDTWLFRYSDTLIRLFPIRFWRDAFIWIGVMALIGGFSIGFYGKLKSVKESC
jgi:integral membrane protein (TIGR01906 family)